MLRKREPKNIVLIRTDRIGEVLLSTIAVDVIKQRFSDVRISFVTSAYSKPLLEDRKDIEEVMTFETMERGPVLANAFRLASMLKKRHFDTAIIFNPHKALHLGCFLAGIPQKIGYDRKWGFLLNDTIADLRDEGEKHEISYTMDLLRLLDVTEPPLKPHLPVSEEAGTAMEDMLRRENVMIDKPLVVVHPGSSNPAKIWPGEHYADLIRRIRTEMDCKVALIGSADEHALAENIIFKSGVEGINLAGVLDLKQLAAFLKKAVLFIGNDAGPMHMAAALNIPVIAIFGRNIPGVSPTRWRPWGAKNVVFHESSVCYPCYDAACPYEHKCLKAITVDSVFEAVKKKLSA